MGDKARKGAVALIDALGLKELRRTTEEGDIIRLLERLSSTVKKCKKEHENDCGPKQEMRHYILSDTIKVVVFSDSQEHDRTITIRDAARVAARVCIEAARSTPKLAFRGAISYGDIHSTANYTLGAAVDEAASLYEQAEGAFVFLTPSAADLFCTPIDLPEILRSWIVPLKQIGGFETYVVNPLALSPSPDDYIADVLSTFTGTNVGVRIKRQATARCLNALRSTT